MRPMFLFIALSILTSCRGVTDLVGANVSPDAPHVAVKIMGAGQSNANNPIIWTQVATDIQSWTNQPCQWDYSAVSNTCSQQWANDDMGMLTALVNRVKSMQPDFILWEQGENDQSTDPITYANNISVIIAAVKNVDSKAKFVTALDGDFVNDPDPRDGQKELVRRGVALMGPDIDALRTPECTPVNSDGSPNPHFTDPCKLKEGDAWFNSLKQYIGK